MSRSLCMSAFQRIARSLHDEKKLNQTTLLNITEYYSALSPLTKTNIKYIKE